MALTAVAAIAGTAAVAAEVVTVGTLMAIGTAATVVGVITKSKELVKIGGALALVGGVGGLVEGLASSAAATGEVVASGAAEAAAPVVEAAAPMMTEAAPASGWISGEMLPAGGNLQSLSTVAESAPLAAPMQAPEMTPVNYQPPAPAAAAPKPFDPTPISSPATPVAETSFNSTGAVAPTAPTGAAAPTTPYDSFSETRIARDFNLNVNNGIESTNAFMSKLNGVANWIENNKTTAFLGAHLLAGAATAQATRDSTKYQEERVAIERERQANMSHTTPLRRSGIINTQRA